MTSNTTDPHDADLHGLIEEVANDKGSEGAAAMADELRDRTDETQVEEEPASDPGD